MPENTHKTIAFTPEEIGFLTELLLKEKYNADFCYFANFHHKEAQLKMTQQLLDKICPQKKK